MSVVEFEDAMIVRPARVFQFPEINTLTMAFAELVKETAPMVLLDPLTSRRIIPLPLAKTYPATKTLPNPLLVMFVWEKPVFTTTPVQSGVM